MTSKKILIIAFIAVIVISMPFCKNNPKMPSFGDEESEGQSKEIAEPKVVEVYDPNAPAQTCVLSSGEFASWFSAGRIAVDGMVNSANSLGAFENSCDFYKWSWQMFLWHFSPTEGSYVYDSPPFYDIEGNNMVFDGVQTKVRGGKLDSEGQAGLVSGVLMSQKAGMTPDGSIVYYAIHVNQAYAYMVSGQKTGHLNLQTFPTTQEDMDMIKEYAKSVHGVEIMDSESLAMELKSSWVKVPKGIDASKYITIKADVPHFTESSDKEWVWDGGDYETNVTLALVGYHVVGSVADHPEMIWATFEHNDNTADVNYYYVNAEGETVEKKSFGPDDKSIRKDWNFTNGDVKVNASCQMYMEMEGNKIIAMSGKTISPSSTIRTHPFGNISSPSTAASNTEIISLNANISSMLANGDARKNYFLVGATWTSNGVPGVGNQLPEVKGSQVLANSTMETYFQYKNCFSCHKGGNINGLSHIFESINPLPGS